MFVGKILLPLVACFIAVATSQSSDPDRWWKTASVYQISPVTFKDSDNDGVGDIQGITSKLDYLVETGFDVIVLSPFYESPLKDFGYDISNHVSVGERFGDWYDDWDELIRQAKRRGLKVLLDFLPNHTSDQHDWFVRSKNRETGFEDFYIWHDGMSSTFGGRNSPPNNWQSVYGGSSWTWSEERQQYYYHVFATFQPDLNLREESVLVELEKVLKTWLDRGADGFRVDAVRQLFEDPEFKSDPDIVNNLPECYDLIKRWRAFLDNYSTAEGNHNRILIPQVWDTKLLELMRYIQDENGTQLAQLPINFMLIDKLDRNSKAVEYKATIDEYLKALPKGAVANWFFGTHDHSRVASRMGTEKIGALTALLLTLPGVAFTYNGDEIAMEDNREISWEDTGDPWACNANPIVYKDLSRDPQRSPIQWDESVNAGFNTGTKPWIAVHPNYTKNNLEAQKRADKSHYKFYKQLLHLRKNESFAESGFDSKVLSENVLALKRLSADATFFILINLGSKVESVSLNDLTVKLEDRAEVLLASPSSSHKIGDVLSAGTVEIAAFDALVLVKSAAATTTLSLLAIVMLAIKLFL